MKKEINVLIVLMLLFVVSTDVACAATSKVIITFDDGWTSQYYEALPIMNANNQTGVAFLITGEVPKGKGTVGKQYMNLSQVAKLYSSGWDLSSHTVTHPYLASLNTSSLNAELNDSKTWLNNNGFTRASMFLAYPYGNYNAGVIAAAKADGYLAARTVNNDGLYSQYNLSSPKIFEMQTLLVCGISAYGNNATPPLYIKNEINKSIARGGLVILSFHNITDVRASAPNDVSEDYLTSDFKEVSDFLRIKQDAGELDVVTMSAYLNPSKIRNKFEYMIVPNMVLATLDQLVGWELVAVVQTDSSTREFYLKRMIT
jgi:peptidoglycan/xylan/chitin deacetylase (PgdA/CDA1 family)